MGEGCGVKSVNSGFICFSLYAPCFTKGNAVKKN
jgi:hypothetical protein